MTIRMLIRLEEEDHRMRQWMTIGMTIRLEEEDHRMRQWMTIGMMIRLEEEDDRMRQRVGEMKNMVLMQIQMGNKMNEIHTI